MSTIDKEKLSQQLWFKSDLDPDITKRVLDPNRSVKDFDDVLELGMYGASELSNHDDLKFLEQFKDIEMGLEENPEFTKLAHSMSVLRRVYFDRKLLKAQGCWNW